MDKSQAVNLILLVEKMDESRIRQFRKTLSFWFTKNYDNPSAMYAIAYGIDKIYKFKTQDVAVIIVILSIILGEEA